MTIYYQDEHVTLRNPDLSMIDLKAKARNEKNQEEAA